MGSGIELKEWDIIVSQNRYPAVLNNLLRNTVGYTSKTKNEPTNQYPSEEYLRVLDEVSSGECVSLSHIQEYLDTMPGEDKDIFFSFFKLIAPGLLDKKYSVSFLDEISLDFFFRARKRFEEIQLDFRDDG